MRCSRERELDLDLVRGLGRHLGLAVARDVLVQRPAAGDVERLRAAADREDRQAALQGELDQAQLEGVEAGLGRARARRGARRAVGRRVEVRAAGEADAVEAVEQRREVVGAGRREHHGDRAGRVERAQVGHPQRHLRVRGLAVTTGRRQPRGAHLRGGDANEGAHPQMIDRIATFRTHRWSKLSQLGFARRSGSKLPGAMSSQYIYTMYKLSRTHPPDKTVLKDINLSFFPGAKIGVLGLNGSGKSTLLRIMAGIDKDYRGEAQLAPGASVGLLSQEPELDESKDVRGNVEDGVRALRDLLDRFNELSMNYSDETADEFARLQDQIDAAGAWELDQMLDQAMDALRCPPGEASVTSLERRREAPRRAGAAAAVPARPAAAGRAHEPPGRRVRRVARAAPGGLQGHDRRGHPRSLLPRQRRGLDPRARPRVGPPLQGQLLLVARAEAEAARAGGEDRVGAPAHDQGRARVGADQPQGPPHQVAGALEPLRGPAGRGAQRQARRRPDPHPARAAARRRP